MKESKNLILIYLNIKYLINGLNKSRVCNLFYVYDLKMEN